MKKASDSAKELAKKKAAKTSRMDDNANSGFGQNKNSNSMLGRRVTSNMPSPYEKSQPKRNTTSQQYNRYPGGKAYIVNPNTEGYRG